MMKRSYGVQRFISVILGAAVGSWIYLAITQLSFLYGVLAILAVIASVLNIIYGIDENDKSKTDEE